MTMVAVIGLLATLFGLISIYVGAFRAHVAWGLLMLLAAPIVFPVFAIRHWRLVRVGLLLVVTGITSVSYASYSAGTWPPHRYLISLSKPENLGILGRVLFGKSRAVDEPVVNNQVPAQAAESSQVDQPEQPVKQPVEQATQEVQQSPPEKKSPPPEVLARLAEQQQQSAATYVEFSMDELPAYFGYRVRVTEIGNKVYEVLLKDQDGSQLVFERQYGSGGAVEFRLESRNILKMEALQP